MKYKVIVLMILPLVNHIAVAAASWQLPAREVPIPAGASEELKLSIDTWPQPDMTKYRMSPASEAEWQAVIERGNAIERVRIAKWPTTLKVKIDRRTIGSVKIAYLTPAVITEKNRNRLFIHLHGGAYVIGGGDAGLGEGLMIANRLGIPVISIDYRMPPVHPYPAAVNDVVSVYKHLLESRDPGTMMIGGTSAGGGLALASVHKFRQIELPFPGAVYAGTAWADLTKTGDTLYTLEGIDRGMVTYDGYLEGAAKLYAADHDMKSPLISPVYGNFEGFPPTLLITGTRDLFLSDVVRTHRKLRAADVNSDLHVYEGMAHGDYLYFIDTPETSDVFRELENFLEKHLEITSISNR